MILQRHGILLIPPIQRLDIPPGLIARRLEQRPAHLGRKTQLPTPHQLPLLVLKRTPQTSLLVQYTVNRLSIRPDILLPVLPRPEAKIRHQPGRLLRSFPRKSPDRMAPALHVVHAVFDREDKLDRILGWTIAGAALQVGCCQGAVHGR